MWRWILGCMLVIQTAPVLACTVHVSQDTLLFKAVTEEVGASFMHLCAEDVRLIAS